VLISFWHKHQERPFSKHAEQTQAPNTMTRCLWCGYLSLRKAAAAKYARRLSRQIFGIGVTVAGIVSFFSRRRRLRELARNAHACARTHLFLHASAALRAAVHSRTRAHATTRAAAPLTAPRAPRHATLLI